MSDQRFSMEPLDGRLLLASGLAADTEAPTYVRYNLNRVSLAASNPFIEFTVTYRDNVQMDKASINNKDIVITGPNRFRATVKAVRNGVTSDLNGRRIKARYRVDATSGPFHTATLGTYSIGIQRNQVKDTSGNAVAPKKYSITITDLKAIRRFINSLRP